MYAEKHAPYSRNVREEKIGTSTLTKIRCVMVLVRKGLKKTKRYIILMVHKMSNDDVQVIKFRKHPIYDLYAGSRCGRYINVNKLEIRDGWTHITGYKYCTIKPQDSKQKKYRLHRFIFECYNGMISAGMVIDHINNVRDDNRSCNLQLMTTSQNNKKAAKNIDFSFIKYNHLNKRSIKAINLKTEEIHYFPSLY